MLELGTRLVRLKEAPKYLGMNKNLFNSMVRPTITEIRLSKQAVAFDRLDLDAWVDQTKRRGGRPITQGEMYGA